MKTNGVGKRVNWMNLTRSMADDPEFTQPRKQETVDAKIRRLAAEAEAEQRRREIAEAAERRQQEAAERGRRVPFAGAERARP